jgi:hypothetical protein
MTLKRFSLLCAQGPKTRAACRVCCSVAPHTSVPVLMGLELLAQLDTRPALQAFRGPQLHLFAGLDGLVPAEAAGVAGVVAGYRNRSDRTGQPRVSSGRPRVGAIQAFCMSAVMTDLSPVPPGGLPDKRQVAASFLPCGGQLRQWPSCSVTSAASCCAFAG